MPDVTVLYFAALRDRLQCERETLSLPEATTAEAVLAVLAERHPTVADLLGRARLAVDLAFVAGPIRLSERSEVAVIPPVSGG